MTNTNHPAQLITASKFTLYSISITCLAYAAHLILSWAERVTTLITSTHAF